MNKIDYLIILYSALLLAQQTPLEKNNYQKLTSYEELTDYIYQLEDKNDCLNVDIIGKSVEGRNLYALKFSGSEFGKDTSKIKILILLNSTVMNNQEKKVLYYWPLS